MSTRPETTANAFTLPARIRTHALAWWDYHKAASAEISILSKTAAASLLTILKLTFTCLKATLATLIGYVLMLFLAITFNLTWLLISPLVFLFPPVFRFVYTYSLTPTNDDSNV